MTFPWRRILGVVLLLWTTGLSQEFGNTSDLFLHPKPGLTIEKVRSFVTMQQHVAWVSQASDAAVVQSLRSSGYEVAGGKVISSESNDQYVKLITTGRLRAYVASKGNDVIICFRGSGGSNPAQTAGNMITDLRSFKEKPNLVGSGNRYAGLVDRVEVHNGFHRAYQRLRPEILSALAPHRGKNLYVFGHSLGGAMATMCAFDIGLNQPNSFASRTLMVSGSPRVGDRNFRNLFESVSPGACRFTVQGDPVARVPSSGRFLHVGDLINVQPNGTLLGASTLHIDLGEGLQRTWAWSNHDYAIYGQAARGLHYNASERTFFNGKANYAKSMGDIERSRARQAD